MLEYNYQKVLGQLTTCHLSSQGLSGDGVSLVHSPNHTPRHEYDVYEPISEFPVLPQVRPS